jgi:hypothetical protein
VCKVRILSGRILQNNKTFPSLSESLRTSSESQVASLNEFHCLGSLEINEGIYFGTCIHFTCIEHALPQLTK